MTISINLKNIPVSFVALWCSMIACTCHPDPPSSFCEVTSTTGRNGTVPMADALSPDRLPPWWCWNLPGSQRLVCFVGTEALSKVSEGQVQRTWGYTVGGQDVPHRWRLIQFAKMAEVVPVPWPITDWDVQAPQLIPESGLWGGLR